MLAALYQKKVIAEHDLQKWKGSASDMLLDLIFDLCTRPSKDVATAADVLDELGLKEKATELRGWLVCQSYQVSDCFDSVIVTYPITSFLTVMSELYKKRLISEDDLRRLSHHRYMMEYSSGHWLDSLVDIQFSKSADVRARTFDTLKSFSLTEVVQERQTKHTGETLTS